MSQKEKFIVLDVEGMSVCRPYNIGFIVADKDGKIYKKYSFAFPECFPENIGSCVKLGQAEKMTYDNIAEILEDTQFSSFFSKKKYKPIQVDDFWRFFVKILKKYKIRKLYAYNVTFDKNALKRLFGAERFDLLGLKYCDIITGILQARLLSKDYINFCIEHNFLTKKKNLMTKAEVVYKYLTGNINFVEEHTGLADVLIEYFILLIAFKSDKALNFTPCQAWKILNNYCEKENILIS